VPQSSPQLGSATVKPAARSLPRPATPRRRAPFTPMRVLLTDTHPGHPAIVKKHERPRPADATPPSLTSPAAVTRVECSLAGARDVRARHGSKSRRPRREQSSRRASAGSVCCPATGAGIANARNGATSLTLPEAAESCPRFKKAQALVRAQT
jgi:hypothetical protein